MAERTRPRICGTDHDASGAPATQPELVSGLLDGSSWTSLASRATNELLVRT
ncbi:hypothetical protein [Streptomyces nitrosporeus]|uniref:hypothetical protein n=1 Tax=Streptomyces nitrosporeus TaxID=28894 RepID=UPI001E5A22B6|nr:hypothetical protein [Streptomyces nitrosporeus]